MYPLIVVSVKGTSGSIDGFLAATKRMNKSVQTFIKSAIVYIWMHGWSRILATLSLAMGLATILFNTWILSHLNHKILPQATEYLSQVTERKVSPVFAASSLDRASGVDRESEMALADGIDRNYPPLGHWPGRD